MEFFPYRDRLLHCEAMPVSALAEQYGTPLWVYSQGAFEKRLSELQAAFAPASPLICYSLKTNGNLHLARLMSARGAGFDVTSAGELHRALLAGGTGSHIVFAGVGKTAAEIEAGLRARVLVFNVESAAEVAAIDRIARQLGVTADLALRINPDVDPQTHPETSTGMFGTKFGVQWDQVIPLARTLDRFPALRLRGLHFHLGSPIYTTQPYREALERSRPLIEELRGMGHPIDYLNCGGGFGINYKRQEALPIQAFADVIVPAVQALGVRLILEPGRYIAGNSGILLSRVIYTKETAGKRFIIQDAAMTDLIRPRLYGAFHRIWPVAPPPGLPAPPDDFEAVIPETSPADVVSSVCETGDFLARNRLLPPVNAGDLLATFSAGAYGMMMSSNYNGRLRAAEVLVHGDQHRLIRRRETLADLVRYEIEV